MGSIRIADRSKSYRTAGDEALRALDEVAARSPTARSSRCSVPDGCGKSTLLNVVAGPIDADGGTVAIPDDDRLGFVSPSVVRGR